MVPIRRSKKIIKCSIHLGFCKKGEGGIFTEKGETSLTGKIPVNTSGGLKSKGHPVGATGIALD